MGIGAALPEDKRKGLDTKALAPKMLLEKCPSARSQNIKIEGFLPITYLCLFLLGCQRLLALGGNYEINAVILQTEFYLPFERDRADHFLIFLI